MQNAESEELMKWRKMQKVKS